MSRAATTRMRMSLRTVRWNRDLHPRDGGDCRAHGRGGVGVGEDGEGIVSGHTPGPWLVTLGEPGCYRSHERLLVVASGDNSAPVAKLPDCWGGTPDGYEQSRANARLMAASPRMLEALKAALAAINPSDIHGISLFEWNKRLASASEVIRAAIIAAERNSDPVNAAAVVAKTEAK